MKGAVKWFSDARGYGFIARADGVGDVFVHHTAIEGMQGRRTLVEGQTVEFNVVPGTKGPSAANVRAIARGAA